MSFVHFVKNKIKKQLIHKNIDSILKLCQNNKT